MGKISSTDLEAQRSREARAMEALRALVAAQRAHDRAAVFLLREARRHMSEAARLADEIERTKGDTKQ